MHMNAVWQGLYSMCVQLIFTEKVSYHNAS